MTTLNNNLNTNHASRALTSKKTVLSTLLVAALAVMSGCNEDDNKGLFTQINTINTQIAQTQPPITLTIAHVNDTHSHLEPEGTQSFMVDKVLYRSKRGGYARLKTVFDELQTQYGNGSGNFLKLNAGDALTGTSYYSFFQGDADADMMNTICFDAFTLGNHEFDEGDAGLKRFLDRLHGSQNNPANCQTPVVSANVIPAIGSPLAPSKVDDYIKPYTITTTKEGVKVGIVGIEIATKTKLSSRPLASTQFLDEIKTAQSNIDALKAQGITHIILLTHYTYDNDKALAAALSGVDVIIGGDSHTLLGDFKRYGQSATDNFGSQGAYPTVLTNKDGDTVCIGQAWEYTKAVGLMNVRFNEKGAVDSCRGSAVIPVAETFERYDAVTKKYLPLDTPMNQTLLDSLRAGKKDLLSKDLILPFAENAAAANLLTTYSNQINTKMAQKIGTASQPLCLVRVPGTTYSATVAGCEDTASQARGSDIAQVVAKAFLDGALRADFALQNAGGVRDSVVEGNITYNTAYTILPFGNTLVNLTITGEQVRNTLEDAIANHLDGGSGSGSHPYADGLRWDLDMTQARGKRVYNLEVRDRKTGVWSPLNMTKTYVMVTNDYIAEGRDGYTTLGPIFADKTKVEDTKLLYTQSFIDYVKKVGNIARPERSDYSHKNVITANGTTLAP